MNDENEVVALLGKLRDGTMTLEQVADCFRRRQWPHERRPEPADYVEIARRAQEDPEPYVPGSWDDVDFARDRGEISEDEYDVLAEAMAEAERAEDRGEL